MVIIEMDRGLIRHVYLSTASEVIVVDANHAEYFWATDLAKLPQEIVDKLDQDTPDWKEWIG